MERLYNHINAFKIIFLLSNYNM